MNFEVGQKVWFTQPLFYKNQGLVEGEIIKIGSKYVYVKKHREFKFYKNTLKEATDGNYVGRIYTSKEKYLDEQELHKNLRQIRKVFTSYNLKLSLNQTKEILRILNNN